MCFRKKIIHTACWHSTEVTGCDLSLCRNQQRETERHAGAANQRGISNQRKSWLSLFCISCFDCSDSSPVSSHPRVREREVEVLAFEVDFKCATCRLQEAADDRNREYISRTLITAPQQQEQQEQQEQQQKQQQQQHSQKDPATAAKRRGFVGAAHLQAERPNADWKPAVPSGGLSANRGRGMERREAPLRPYPPPHRGSPASTMYSMPRPADYDTSPGANLKDGPSGAPTRGSGRLYDPYADRNSSERHREGLRSARERKRQRHRDGGPATDTEADPSAAAQDSIVHTLPEPLRTSTVKQDPQLRPVSGVASFIANTGGADFVPGMSIEEQIDEVEILWQMGPQPQSTSHY